MHLKSGQIHFLDASKHLYKTSVRPSIRNAFFFRIRESAWFRLLRSRGTSRGGKRRKEGEGGRWVRRGRGRGEEGGRVDEAARDASDVWRDQTCFSISTPLFLTSLEVLIFWAFSASNVLRGVLSYIWHKLSELCTKRVVQVINKNFFDNSKKIHIIY